MEVLEKSLVITGTIEAFKANKHGDIDSFEIEDKGKNIRINFPPHTAQAIQGIAKNGQDVKITYKEEQPKHDPKGDKKPKNKLESISSDSADEIIIKSIKPAKHSESETPASFEIKHFELLKGKKDELIGIKAENKLFHIHKDDDNFAGKITPKARLVISAVKREDSGFINKDGDIVYHIKSINIEGVEYTSVK